MIALIIILWFAIFGAQLFIASIDKTHRFIALRYPAAVATIVSLIILGIKLYART